MCKKVERVTAKTGCTSCTKWTISFEVSGFQTKTFLLQRDFIFLILFELQSFCVLKMHHSKPNHQFSTLSDFICYFSCIYWLFRAIRPWNWKAQEMNFENRFFSDSFLLFLILVCFIIIFNLVMLKLFKNEMPL